MVDGRKIAGQLLDRKIDADQVPANIDGKGK
jgi:hypothetical protein